MTEAWQYQIRLELDELAARLARRDPRNPVLKPLNDVLGENQATLVCQLDAFVDYVAEAERSGSTDPLLGWTKATIANPKKVDKYSKSFSVQIEGQSVYDKPSADRLEAGLQPLVGQGIVIRMARHDTNPQNNPQPPARFRS